MQPDCSVLAFSLRFFKTLHCLLVAIVAIANNFKHHNALQRFLQFFTLTTWKRDMRICIWVSSSNDNKKGSLSVWLWKRQRKWSLDILLQEETRHRYKRRSYIGNCWGFDFQHIKVYEESWEVVMPEAAKILFAEKGSRRTKTQKL